MEDTEKPLDAMEYARAAFARAKAIHDTAERQFKRGQRSRGDEKLQEQEAAFHAFQSEFIAAVQEFRAVIENVALKANVTARNAAAPGPDADSPLADEQ